MLGGIDLKSFPIGKKVFVTNTIDSKCKNNTGDVIVEMPDPPKPQPSDMQPGVSASGSRPLVDVEEPLIQHLHEPPIPGIGVDILKAIVYGGLLECIISLSVITSAAGGDATTCEFPKIQQVFDCIIMLVTLHT